MRFVLGKPKRKGKPKRSPLDANEQYLLLRQHIAAGKLKPQEQAGMEITEADAKALGVKNARRLVKDHLTRFLKGSGLASDYWIISYLQENGNPYVGVVFEPPMSASQKSKKSREAAS
jgi:hypothetical protein